MFYYPIILGNLINAGFSYACQILLISVTIGISNIPSKTD